MELATTSTEDIMTDRELLLQILAHQRETQHKVEQFISAANDALSGLQNNPLLSRMFGMK